MFFCCLVMPTVVQPSYAHCAASWLFIDHVFFCLLPIVMPTVGQPSYAHCAASWSFIDHVFFCVLPDSWHKSGSHLPLCLAKRCEGGFPLCSSLYSVLSRNIYQILSDSSFLTVQCAVLYTPWYFSPFFTTRSFLTLLIQLNSWYLSQLFTIVMFDSSLYTTQ